MRGRKIAATTAGEASPMLTDRYELPLSISSAAARDAFVVGCDRLLTFYPGAIEAFDCALAADPGFALAHAGKAQVFMRQGNVAAAREALGAAKAAADGVTAREAGHIGFFDLVFSGREPDGCVFAFRVRVRGGDAAAVERLVHVHGDI